MLNGDDDIGGTDFAARHLDVLQVATFRRSHDGIKGVVGELEFTIGKRRDACFKLVGDAVVAEHNSQHTRGTGWVAVGVLPAAGGDLQGLVEIRVPEEQAEGNESPIEFGVDVERLEPPIRAAWSLSHFASIDCQTARQSLGYCAD